MRPTSHLPSRPTRPVLTDEIADMLGVLAISTATIAMLWLPALIAG